MISLKDKDINYCLGCSACTNKLKDYCIIKDDMKEIYEDIIQAEKIIIASPIYMNFITGKLKNLIDRLNPYSSHSEILNGKKIYLILTGQLDEEENEEICNNINKYFKGLAEFMEFDFSFLGYLCSGDVEKVNDVTKFYEDYDSIVKKLKLQIN